MSVQAMSWVIKHSPHKGSELLCLIMIADHASPDGTNAYPSMRTLAAECRMSERQVARIVARLEASQAIFVDRSGGRVSHVYTVNMAVVEQSNPDKMSALPVPNPDNLTVLQSPNPDKLSVSNPDKMSTLHDSTLTSCPSNPDISGVNPDIAMSYKPIEPSMNYSLLPTAHASADQQSVVQDDSVVATLSRADWISDDRAVIAERVARSFVLVPAFSPADALFQSEMFVRYWERRGPPKDWFRSWCNWLRKAVEHDSNSDRQRTTRTTPRTGGAVGGTAGGAGGSDPRGGVDYDLAAQRRTATRGGAHLSPARRSAEGSGSDGC